MTLRGALKEHADGFEYLSQREKLMHLIELGKEMTAFPKELRNENNLVKGCASRVYIHACLQEGKLVFSGEADSLTVNGYVALLVDFFSGYEPSRFIEDSTGELEEFLEVTKIRENLVASRADAFGNIHAAMMIRAKQLAGKEKC